MRELYKNLFAFVLLLAFSSIHVSAYDWVEEGICYDLDKENHTASVVGVTTNTKHEGILDFDSSDDLNTELHIVIPSSIVCIGEEFEEYKVTSIGHEAFSGNTDLASIVISNGVTRIFGNAFDGCTGLSSITIPGSVTTIDGYAFRGCSKLKSITIPNGVTSIEWYTFQGCSGLTSITIPNGVTSIGNQAFDGCSNLTSIIIPDGVTYIGYQAFSGCSSLSSITIPDGVTIIGYLTFCDCSSLTSVIIPNSVVDIIDGSFYNCSSLTNIMIPGSVKSIGKSAFQGCSSLKSIIVPDGVTHLEEYAFFKCSSLSSVIIPNSVTKIDEAVFSRCTRLTSIKIPGSVKTIGRGAFSLCTNLTSVTISDGVEDIGYGVFNKCPSLTEVTIPNSVTKIGEYAFNECTCSIICMNEEPPAASSSSFNSNMTAYVPASAVEPYRNAVGWKEMTIMETVPDIEVVATAGPSHLIVTGGYSSTNLTVTEFGFEGYVPFEDEIEVYGLDPETEYAFTFYIDTKEAGRIKKECTFRTSELTINTTDPKVVSVENGRSNVIVSVQTNLDDNEKNVGFEWRREDAPEALRWNSSKIPLYDGMMEGYIRNVQADKFWWVRPYYQSDSGNYYYGEQVMWDANDISYCEPVVHTSKKVKISKNIATVEGYALSGTENISSQGMKYWKATNEGGEASEKQRDDAAEVKASGYSEVMTVDIKGLEYDATYNYVAFVMTADGKTYYGETRVFTTEPSPADVNVDGIVDISDIVAVINHIAGTNDYRRADVNADGLVDISDIVAIINAIASM